MDCLELREKFESGASLDEQALGHVKGCALCRSYIEEEEKLSGLLSSLPKIDAPADFNFAVSSRISAANEPRAWGWTAIKIGLPVGAMSLIIALAVINSNVFNPVNGAGDPRIEIAGDPAKQPVFKIEEVDENEADGNKGDDGKGPSKGNPGQSPDPPLTASKATVDERKPTFGPDEKVTVENPRPGIRSLDQGAEEPDVMNPPGLEPDREIDKRGPVQDKKFSVVEVLSALGVAASWKANKLIVEAVAKSGIGERSGVRQGDQVIAMDGVAVSKQPVRGGVVRGRSITIVRSGRRMIINVGSQD